METVHHWSSARTALFCGVQASNFVLGDMSGPSEFTCLLVFPGGPTIMGIYMYLPSGYVKIAIEHGHRNSWFSH